jgi:formamidopyrimidine-DNA glycosylase
MPELPEVETIKRQLAKELVGKKLGKKKIISIDRRGKMIFFNFDDGSALVFHLKLTCQLILNQPPSRFTRKVFNFDDGSILLFNDSRRFGWYKIVKNPVEMKEVKGLGPEPLNISQKDFCRLFKNRNKRKIKIKTLLLSQKFIAGIGNIYADEILFAAGVSPLRPVSSLREQEIKNIYSQTQKILLKAIDKGGSSVENYLTAKGEKGKYSQLHKVYQKTGLPCWKCQAPIKRIVLGGRGTHFCPVCQN